MNDTETMLVNEYRRIERALARRRAQVAALEKQAARAPAYAVERPKRYAVEFSFEPGDLQEQSKSFLVDGGTRFKCLTVESNLRVVGNVRVDDGGGGVLTGQSVQMTLGYGFGDAGGSYRNEFFSFQWAIRDTGSDREWQNEKMPDVFLMSGHLAPLWLPIPSVVEGGSHVAVDIDPLFNRVVTPGSPDGLLATITKYIVQISFHGVEVAG